MKSAWRIIPSSFSELNLEVTLTCAQSFRWSKLEDGTFRGVLGDGVWTLSQCPDTGNLLYTVTRTSAPQKKPAKRPRLAKVQNEDDSKLRDYFNLDVGLEQLHHNWGLEDPDYLSLSKQHSGIRILRQDPVENLFSFICSSNNNIPRQHYRSRPWWKKLCTHLGPALLELDGHQFHQFPAVEALAQPDVEPLLRKLGFGYRAKYIQQSAAKICQEREPGWLMGLRDATYEEAHAALIKLPGIGAKVADCICLMSLDKWEAVPLDIHMWNLARRQYLPHLQSHKSLTDRTYREIGESLAQSGSSSGRNLGNMLVGAHEVLFCGELKQFKNRKAS
ncbi:OGG1 [Cordylochernes scorpioides]|uniref:DNA-(apurinic or apyrimidinic site) lyase n=1 Tax=Cordylochernes scorpioides TaxID=51811 RepID=A0ABY6K0W9_9ARAC|nr:OGG1 [Cordylochernes scorpioides]